MNPHERRPASLHTTRRTPEGSRSSRLRIDARRLRPLALAALLVLLGGCGFQPRGDMHGLAGIPSPLYVSGIASYTPLHRELKRQLEQQGVVLVADAGASSAVLNIRDREYEKRVLSVDSRNKTIENELEESARFELLAPDRRVLSEAQTVRVLRVHFAPRDAVLGSRREATLLREDMRRELVQRMLQRIAAQH